MLRKVLTNLLFSAFSVLSLWGPPSHAAGTLPLAMAQQVDVNGQPLANCQVLFFQAGTPATPQNAFADFGLTQTLPNPLSCDQTGRIPMFWLADGLIHVRLTDQTGLQIIDTTMQVLGPSSGGGGGGNTVDPTTILATGDLKVRYGTGALAGWVRMNGLTIGNATCGCTERSNADTQALFIYLYNADSTLAVSGGRTGNALNDFNASKQLSLPDWRGRALAALADMGNSDVGLFAGVTFARGNPTTLGSLFGAARRSLAVGNIPAITSSNASQSISVAGGGSVSASGSNTINVSGTPTITVNPVGFLHVPGTNGNISGQDYNNGAGALGPNFPTSTSGGLGDWANVSSFAAVNTIALSGSNTINVSGTATVTASGNNSISVTSTGTLGSAFDSVSPYGLATIYVKL